MTTITSEPIDRPEGCTAPVPARGKMSLLALATALQAARIHVETGGRMRLTANATPSNLAATLNQHFPNRPEGPFKARTMAKLLPQIAMEHDRQCKADSIEPI